MKKRKLKKEVKVVFIILVVFTLILADLNKKSKDELGNTCYGTIIQVCGKE